MKPATVEHTGDPVVFVLSANSHRRHITKGQRAMAGWLGLQHLPETERPSIPKSAERIGVSQGLVGNASMVAKWCPDKIDAVISGAQPLGDAYSKAQARKAAADSDEARFASLPPDLAAQVREESLTLAGALAAAATAGRTCTAGMDHPGPPVPNAHRPSERAGPGQAREDDHHAS